MLESFPKFTAQGDCLAGDSGSPMKRLLQVTDMDSARRIHVPAWLWLLQAVSQIFLVKC